MLESPRRSPMNKPRLLFRCANVMPLTLENPHLSFALDLPDGLWSLHSHDHAGALIADAHMSARYRLARRSYHWNGALADLRAQSLTHTQSLHGELQQLTLEC